VQTSQQTSPDWFERDEYAQENIWSEQADEHSAQPASATVCSENEHGAWEQVS